jgi:hypothetical protein
MYVAPAALPYHLRIGVTGHRELPDPEGVVRAVDALLDDIDRTLMSASEHPGGPFGAPRTPVQRLDSMLARGARSLWPWLPLAKSHTPVEQRTPLRWTVISPLAKGTDRIVAHSVLARPHSRLKVIVPFELDEYRRDFVEPDDRAEFEALLVRDDAPTTLAHPYGTIAPGASEAEIRGAMDCRNEGYFNVGCRVVEGCEILIAVWDGQAAAGKGGTSDVVHYAVAQGRLVIWIDSRNPAKPPRVLSRPDRKSAEKSDPIQIGPLPRTACELSRAFCQLAAYNGDAAYNAEECEVTATRVAGEMRAAAQTAGLAESELAPIFNHLLAHYARADQLAMRYQQLYVRAAVGLYCLAATAVTLAVLQTLFFVHQWWLTAVEIIAMAAAFVLLRISRSEGWHGKWLHDRHLAERLRTSFFMVFQDPPWHGWSHGQRLLPFYRGPHSWLNDVVDDAVGEARQTVRERPGFHMRKRFLIDGWVASQAAWHARNAERKGRASRRAHRISSLLFSVTLVMAAVHLISSGHEMHAGAGCLWVCGRLVIFLAIILPAWGAATHAINTLRERERIAARSSRMATVLRGIAERMEHTSSEARFREALAEAEQVMAAENHEWWILLSFSGLVLPA